MNSPLHAVHEELGATFTTFEGHTMPLKYSSIQDEHMAVRHHVGIFDVSHMGAVLVTGTDAPNFVGKITTCKSDKVKVGMGFYTTILRENGTIIDDEVFLRLQEEEYLFVPNAGRHEVIDQWFQLHADNMDVSITDRSEAFVILAIQGRRSMDTLQNLIEFDLENMKLFACHELQADDGRFIVSRTGYTGEKGYELYIKPSTAGLIWLKDILAAGAPFNIKPIGLGARDTLRLEKGFALAGNEFTGGRSPLEAGLNWIIDWDHDFIGKKALEAQKGGAHDRLFYLECAGRGVPRHGQQVKANEQEAGIITSGTFSPCLKKGIAMAYIYPEFQNADTFDIVAGTKYIAAKQVKPPFVKQDQC